MQIDSFTTTPRNLGFVPTTVTAPSPPPPSGTLSPQAVSPTTPTFPQDQVSLSAAALQRLQADQTAAAYTSTASQPQQTGP